MGFISPVFAEIERSNKISWCVQSPALRLVVDREIEIEKFKSEEY